MNNIEKRKKYVWILYYCLYVIGIVLMHKYMVMDYGDDNVSKQLTEGYSLVEWVVFRYNNWSARFIQEGLGYFMIWHPILWKLLDIIIMSSIPLCLVYLVNAVGDEKYVCIFVFLLYPIIDMKSAGWICTTNTYLWPAFFGLIACAYMKKCNDKQNCKWYEWVMFFIAEIIACNHELLAVLLLLIMIYYVANKLLTKQKAPIMLYLGVVIDVINIMVILFSPGNQLRKQMETANHFTEYESFNFVDKIYLGIVHIFKILVIEQNAIFLFLCIIIGIAAVCCLKETYKKIIGLIPVSSILIIKTIIPMYNVEEIKIVDFRKLGTYLPLLMAIGLLIAITLSLIYLLFDKNDYCMWCFPIILLYGGLATQLAMGFLPTIYASGNRTATFMYFSMMYCILSVLQLVKIKYKKTYKGNCEYGYIFAMLGVMAMFAQMYLLRNLS